MSPESTLADTSDGSRPQRGGAEPATIGFDSVVPVHSRSILERLFASQAFWVLIALLIICAVMGIREPHFATEDNFYNITRNFAFIGIMALGMTTVIITGGIDLSVGSIMGVVAVASGLELEAQYPWYVAICAGFGAGALCGVINGVLIAYVELSAFVVTLGMLSMARSVAVVLSGNRMIYNFGPGGPMFKSFGGSALLGIANPVWFLLGLTILLAIVLKMTSWGRHLLAIGGNEHASTL